MKVSGFSFVRNAVKLYYPVRESLLSILPVCDEFVIAVGKSDDETLELIKSIGDERVIIIETEWDSRYFVNGAINAQQTDIALSRCTGDWCFYIQADEVVHEKYLPLIKEKMERYLNDSQVEGFLFDYKHFWGDYRHYQTARHWYSREVRIIRNRIGVSSWKDAQGFRRNGKKLRVIHSGAEVYHYGWVRPPWVMKKKQIAMDSLYHDQGWIDRRHPVKSVPFEYGTLKHLALFKDSHPSVMEERIKEINWECRENKWVKHRHNNFWVRLVSFIENRILHTHIGEYKNYILLRR